MIEFLLLVRWWTRWKKVLPKSNCFENSLVAADPRIGGVVVVVVLVHQGHPAVVVEQAAVSGVPVPQVPSAVPAAAVAKVQMLASRAEQRHQS